MLCAVLGKEYERVTSASLLLLRIRYIYFLDFFLQSSYTRIAIRVPGYYDLGGGIVLFRTVRYILI